MRIISRNSPRCHRNGQPASDEKLASVWNVLNYFAIFEIFITKVYNLFIAVTVFK